MQFDDFIDEAILVLIPRLHPKNYQTAIVRGVEHGGLWLEIQDVTDATLQALGVPTLPKTLIFFWPYHQIVFAIAPSDETSLDEKAFGL